jgi:hypothetical protein
MTSVRLSTMLAFALGCGASAPTAPNAEPIIGTPEAPPPGTSARVTAGTLMGAGRYQARGTARLTVTGSVAILELDPDFRASAVPDPVLYIGTTADPNVGSALRIGRFRPSGAQRFAFALSPAQAASVRFVMLWCDAFNAPVGYAELASP